MNERWRREYCRWSMSRDGFGLAVWNPVGENPTVKTSLDHLPTLGRLALQRMVDVLRAAIRTVCQDHLECFRATEADAS